ncbi:3-oxoacyl-ACP reductase FabG [Bacillus sp. SG-1]|uniref:3-oxoacyl-ACP reductase FabG n=1 Tax=Bacillus sp. SG-1 TaxID=161544 RepID=UPI000154504F|nr:3-oxoacyl-ACP reductase FabG [Bacillus sp. SG-1]EDL64062.1 3-oxoacyl-(acyl-carrier-protein) reductase [Bacillus sp. SG-1]
MRLKNKTAVITGSANGIGLAAAKKFAQEGCKVIMADYDENKGAAEAEKLQEEGGDTVFYQVDVANRESVDNLAAWVLRDYGSIDILINNAGITRDALMAKMREDDFQRVLDVNLTGVFHCTQALLPALINSGKGKIINTASASGLYGNVGQTNYAASKAAVIGMTKTWAKEFGPKGINVNAVAPGVIETEMTASIPDKVKAQMNALIPLGKFGKPEDAANAYLFLASDESDYVNGVVLQVDGGIMM